VVPKEIVTAHGIARARGRADLIGHVGMAVRMVYKTVIKRTELSFDPDTFGRPWCCRQLMRKSSIP